MVMDCWTAESIWLVMSVIEAAGSVGGIGADGEAVSNVVAVDEVDVAGNVGGGCGAVGVLTGIAEEVASW